MSTSVSYTHLELDDTGGIAKRDFQFAATDENKLLRARSFVPVAAKVLEQQVASFALFGPSSV